MSYQPIRQRHVRMRFSAAGFGSLAELAALYRTTVAAIYAETRGARSSTTHGQIEQFAVEIERDPTAWFHLPIPPEERAQRWKRVSADNHTLQSVVDRENAERQREGLPPVTTAFVWNLAMNAPARAETARIAPDERQARLAVFNPIGLAPGVSIWIPRELGQIQQALRAQPNGTLVLEPVPPWLLTLRRRLSELEIDLNSLEGYRIAAERAAAEATQESTYATLLEKYTALMIQNRAAAIQQGYTVRGGPYEPLHDAMVRLRDQARAHMVRSPVEVENPPLIEARGYYARRVVDFLQNDAEIHRLVEQLQRERTTVALGEQTFDWWTRTFERGMQLANGLPEGEPLMAAIERGTTPAASQSGASASAASPGAALSTLNYLAQLGPMFVGNAPGPANLTVAALQAIAYRDLARRSMGQAAPAADRQLLSRLIRVFRVADQREVDAVRAQLATMRRTDIEAAARRVTGNVHSGQLYSSVLLVCVGISLMAALDAPGTDVPTVLMSVMSAQASGTSSFAQLLIPFFERRSMTAISEATSALGEVAGRAAALLQIVAAGYSLVQYLRAPHPDGINPWQVTSYALSVLAGVLTLAAYLEMVPYGQLIGAFLTLGALVTALIADPQAAQEWWDGQVKTFLKKVLERLESQPHYRAISRRRPELAAALRNARTVVEALPHWTAFRGQGDLQAYGRTLRELVTLGLTQQQANQMFRSES